MAKRLFVYGTLRGEARHPMHAVLAGAGHCLGRAEVAGRLYRVDWYPGLVIDDASDGDRVTGDVWVLDDDRALRELDTYEGSEFARRPVTATLADGSAVHAEAFIYHGEHDSGSRIPSGDWLRPD